MLFFARKADKKTAEKSGFPILQDPKKSSKKKLVPFKRISRLNPNPTFWGNCPPPPFFLEKPLTVNQQRLFEPATSSFSWTWVTLSPASCNAWYGRKEAPGSCRMEIPVAVTKNPRTGPSPLSLWCTKKVGKNPGEMVFPPKCLQICSHCFLFFSKKMGNLMSFGRVLFVAQWNEENRTSSYLLKMYGFKHVSKLCVLKRIQWSAQADEVSWTSRKNGRIELDTNSIFLHAWAKVIRRMQQLHGDKQLWRFDMQTINASNPSHWYPQAKKTQDHWSTKWCHFFVRHKTKPGPFCDHPGNEPMVTTSAANTFLSQPQKSPNISLLAGFPAATVSFVEEKTKENYDESKPYSPTLSRSHHFLVKVLSKVIT